MQKKSLDAPDETRTFDKGKVEVAKIGDTSIGRAYFEPGWSWEKCVKPIAKTESCQAPHTQYVVSGRWMMEVKKNMVLAMSPRDTMHG